MKLITPIRSLLFAFYLSVVFSNLSYAADVRFEPLIRIDQFGYLPDEQKIAVISEPVVGFNAATDYAVAPVLQVREWFTEAVVFEAEVVDWKAGLLHEQSGDRGKLFDFSAVTTDGTYYLYDAVNEVASYPFSIAQNVYQKVLEVASKTFFIQRLNFDRMPPFVDEAWSDTAAYGHAGQDVEARSRWDKENPETARDVHGGWMDAGDPNKYTTFAENVVIDLLDAYLFSPEVFTDLFGIPESGNGIPDILDEVKYELDWLTRMQDASGTGGLFLKVGVDNHNASRPLSLDRRPRYYVPECTSSTLAGANMFAKAALVFRNIPKLTAYAGELEIRALEAWNRGKESTHEFTAFETDCDDQDVTSGDADRNENDQWRSAVVAAVYLYQLTQQDEFLRFILDHFQHTEPVSTGWWGPYSSAVARALLGFRTYLIEHRESILAGETFLETELDGFIEIVHSQKAAAKSYHSVDDFLAQTDLYRAHMPDSSHHWGSNHTRASSGSMNLDFVDFGIVTAQVGPYEQAAKGYLHWFHGVNPLGKVMLSNMSKWGAENSVNEFYHTWFADGSDWDRVGASIYGPAPGYIVGGPNRNYTGTEFTPPHGQPPQKSYLDFNDGWPHNSWEVTENAIYYQSAYIQLLSRIMPADSVPVFHDPQFETDFELSYLSADHLLVLNHLTVGDYTLNLLNSDGQTLHAQPFSVVSGFMHFQPPQLEAGVYYLEMVREGVGAIRQFQIEQKLE